jgi:putative transposase
MHVERGMARSRRIRAAGVCHHVIQRGNNRTDIFRTDGDYRVFLAMLREASSRYEFDIHGYVLMRNHVHVLGTPQTPSAVERTMQVIGSRYAGYFNRRHARTGSLFEGRYKSSFVDDERYWITCLRYIELNPVRAGLVSTPADYRWSSHRANALGLNDELLSPHERYVNLGATDRARQQLWKTLCAESLSNEDLERMRFDLFEKRLLAPAVR